MAAQLSNPHDRFFKEVFSRQEIVVDFLRNYLPPEMAPRLDFSTLEASKDSFIDVELREHFSDLLYQVILDDDQTAKIYLLFEHKSYPEPLIAFQLLRYQVRIWEQALKEGREKPFSPIVPIVLYHGTTHWRIALNFAALFADDPAFAAFLPDFRYQLCDLSAYSDEEIQGEALLRVVLLVMRYVFRGDLNERLPGILALLRELARTASGLEFLEIVLRYLSAAASQLEEEGLQHAMETAFPETGGDVMPTIAEKWIEQGLEQGLERGLERGMLQATREAILDILKIRFFFVPANTAAAINAIDDTDALRRLRAAAITASSLDDFDRQLWDEAP